MTFSTARKSGLAGSVLTTTLVVLTAVFQSVSGFYNVDDSVGLGRRFDGIGGLSGGGATSKLLVNYPKQQRDEILDYLFKPNFGAALQILKVEIGGDAQSTDGTEASHMHESWDENYERGYEWWLMLEAKKRNPAIKLYGLPWAFPGWVGHGTGDPYKYPDDTARYVINWLLAAKKIYNLDIDYVGIWNERNYNIVYVETLKNALVASGLTKIQMVVADGDWGPSDDVLKNATFASAVDIIGCHYPGTTSTPSAVKTDKPLWASEDYSTFNDNVGAGCWARILNQNHVNGNMTSTISWNLIAAYYETLPFGRDGLMTAEEPWSGHYVVDNPIWITAHTTQFTEIGWSYLRHGFGVGLLDKGGSYVSLLSPDRKNFTMVIETMSHDHSLCIRPGLPAYNVSAQQAEFQLDGTMKAIDILYVWKTSLGYDGKMSNVFEKQPSIKPLMGMFVMNLDPDAVYTLTTMTTGVKGNYPNTPESKTFPLPYTDDYESYMEFSEAFNFAPQSGVWEIRKTMDSKHGNVNRQVLLNDPIYWCNTHTATINLGGDAEWTDIFVKTDFFIPTVNGTNGVFLAARIDRGGCAVTGAQGVFYTVFPGNNSYVVSSDLGKNHVLVHGSIASGLKNDTWFTLGLIVNKGDAYGFFNDDYVFHISLSPNVTKGFAGYGTVSIAIADFDNLDVTSSSSTSQSWKKGRQVIPDARENIIQKL